MLQEMQNAMNSMMSKNGELHNMLHGDQSSSSSDAGSSSSTSESPSCSSPSSPRCPQDSESVVSMDTNSSSSCASDSSEDEGVATVSRPDAMETSCDGSAERRPESSNRWSDGQRCPYDAAAMNSTYREETAFSRPYLVSGSFGLNV